MKRTLTLLTITSTARAYSKFQIECTIPPTSVNFVSSVETRGTLDILWNCLFTIFACTYTIQHLNIPKQRFNQDRKQGIRGFWDDFRWNVGRLWTPTKWMLITIIAPELIMGNALGSYIAAREGRRKMREFAERDGVEWCLSHAFVANMGGFVLATTLGSPHNEGLDVVEQDRKEALVIARDASTNMKGFEKATQSPDVSLRRPKDGTPQVLMGYCLWELRKSNFIVRLSDITKEEIWDKSKGSVFVKVLAVSQVLWNIIQVIARLAKGLPIAALEVAVVAFSACAMVTYILLLRNPQGIEVPFRALNCNDLLERMKSGRNGQGYPGWALIAGTNWNTSQTWRDRVSFWSDYPPTLSTFDWAYVPNDVSPFGSRNSELWGCLLGGTMFGGIHLAAWILSFTTHLDTLLWRVSSILTTSLTAIILLYNLAGQLLGKNLAFNLKGQAIMHFAYLVAVLVYVVVRLILLVEYFRDLFFLSPDAYISTWATSIPHVG